MRPVLSSTNAKRSTISNIPFASVSVFRRSCSRRSGLVQHTHNRVWTGPSKGRCVASTVAEPPAGLRRDRLRHGRRPPSAIRHDRLMGPKASVYSTSMPRWPEVRRGGRCLDHSSCYRELRLVNRSALRAACAGEQYDMIPARGVANIEGRSPSGATLFVLVLTGGQPLVRCPGQRLLPRRGRRPSQRIRAAAECRRPRAESGPRPKAREMRVSLSPPEGGPHGGAIRR